MKLLPAPYAPKGFWSNVGAKLRSNQQSRWSGLVRVPADVSHAAFLRSGRPSSSSAVYSPSTRSLRDQRQGNPGAYRLILEDERAHRPHTFEGGVFVGDLDDFWP